VKAVTIRWSRVSKSALALALCSLLLACCDSAQAQQSGKIFRIGFLDSSTASGSAVLVDAFRQEMRKHGWIEGKNITIEYRFAEGEMTVYLGMQRTWFVLRSM
jgi:hypothetical protein